MAVEYAYLTAAITIETGVNDRIYFEELVLSPPSGATYTATIAAGTYFLFAHPSNSNSILKAIKTAMEAAGGGTYDWDYSGSPYLVFDQDNHTAPGGYASTGNIRWTYTITAGGDAFTIYGAHANTTFDLTLIGLDQSTISSLGGSNDVMVNSRNSTAIWVPSEAPTVLDYKQSQDADVMQVQTRDHTVQNFKRGEIRRILNAAWELLPDSVAQSDGDLLESDTGSFFEFWEKHHTGKFRVFSGEEDTATVVGGPGSILPYSETAHTNVGRWFWAFDEQAVRSVPRARYSPGLERFSLSFRALETT